MITQFLLDMILGMVNGLFSVIPSWNVSTSTVTQFSSWGTFAGSANGYVPEQELFLCIGVLLAVRVFFLAWRGALFIYHLVPFNGG